jgi:hypothetical protein
MARMRAKTKGPPGRQSQAGLRSKFERMTFTTIAAPSASEDFFHDPKSKAELVREAIEADPSKPNKQIARETGADPKQVRREREKLGKGVSPHIPPEDFDWDDPELTTLREQPLTAIYINPYDQLVIRQRRWPDEDALIFISQESVDAFLDRLTDVAGIPSVGKR